MAYLGIDLGGTYARAAVVDSVGQILASAKIALTDRSPPGVVEAIGRAADEALREGGEAATCGVGVAGMLDRDTGVVTIAPNLGWRNVPFGQLLSDRLARPVRVVNDLSAAAWGELKSGSARGASDVFVVFVGSGVGSAIIAGGRLITGSSGAAGEFGHVKMVTQDGRACGCGGAGCLEAYAGGHHLHAQMAEVLASGRPSILRDTAGDDATLLTPVLLEEAALAGDAAAKEIYDRASSYLSLAIANQVSVLNPRVLVLGGGVLMRCPGMRESIAAGIQRHATPPSRAAVSIAQAALGDDSGIIGAALLASEQ